LTTTTMIMVMMMMRYRCTSLTSEMIKRIAEVTMPDQLTWNCRSRRRRRVLHLVTPPALQHVDHRSPTRAHRPSDSRRPSLRQRRCCWISKGWRHGPRRRRESIPLRSCLGRRRRPRQRCVIPDQARDFIEVQSRDDQQWLIAFAFSLFLELLVYLLLFLVVVVVV